jgi:hypothetical protein
MRANRRPSGLPWNRGTRRFQGLLTRVLSAAVGGLVITAASAGAALAGAAQADTAQAQASPALMACGEGAAQTRPASVILACADDGELAEHLVWSSWTASSATASGDVTWKACATRCVDGKQWDSAAAGITLSRPVNEPGQGLLFTRLTLHVTGSTPGGFQRQVTFSEVPLPASVASPSLAPKSQARPGLEAAASGSLGYSQIEGFWQIAGGPTGLESTGAGTYTIPQIAAAITGAESSFLPGIIQPGVDYCGAGADRAGWGLWQITCGNSVPAFGTDFQLLDPWNNAEAAVSKYQADAAAGLNGFDPWSTFLSGAFEQFLQTTSADTNLTDPGEYDQVNSTPPGTPSSPAPDPGSTSGPPMPGGSPPSAPSPLAEDSAGEIVAFVNSSGRLVNDYYLSSWQGPGVLPGTPRADSPIVVSPDGKSVYFIQSNGDVVNDYYTASAWAGPARAGGVAKAGSSLAFTPGSSSAGTGPAVAFVDTSGALVNDYHLSSGWAGPGPLPGSPRAGTPLAWNATGTGVFFIESNGDVATDTHSSSGWAGPARTGGVAKAGSALAYAPGNGTTTGANVMFIATSGALVNDYFTASSWHGPGPLPGTPR